MGALVLKGRRGGKGGGAGKHAACDAAIAEYSNAWQLIRVTNGYL